jgi:hypothetical protein
MVKKETITISIDGETLDLIRKQALAAYRSISKHIAFILDKSISKNSLDFYINDIIDFLESLENGNIDNFNVMTKATKLLKMLKAESDSK